jgi:hypothetical protein
MFNHLLGQFCGIDLGYKNKIIQKQNTKYETRYPFTVINKAAMAFNIKGVHYKETANSVFIHACRHVGIDMSKARVFYLEAEQLRTTAALIGAGVKSKRLYIANTDSAVAKSIRQRVRHTSNCSSTEFLTLCTKRFNAVWLDYCCTPKKTYEDPALLFGRGLMKPGIIAATFCRRGVGVEKQLDIWTDMLYSAADDAGYDLCELINENYKTMTFIIWEVKRSMDIDFHIEAAKSIGEVPVFEEANSIIIDNMRFYSHRPECTSEPAPTSIEQTVNKSLWYLFQVNKKHYWCKARIVKILKSGKVSVDYGGSALETIIVELDTYGEQWFLVSK